MTKSKIIVIGRDICPNKMMNILINIIITAIPMTILIGFGFFRIDVSYALYPLFILAYFIIEYCVVRICEIIMPKIMMLSFGVVNALISIIIFSFLCDIDFLSFSFEGYIYLIAFSIIFVIIRAILKNAIRQIVFKRIIIKKLKGIDKNEKNDR